MPTLCPGKRYEEWVKDGEKMGEATQCPPFAQARGRKCGERMGGRWEKGGHRQSPHPPFINHPQKNTPNQEVPNIPIKTDC